MDFQSSVQPMTIVPENVPDMGKYVNTGIPGETSGTQRVITKLLVSNAIAGSVIGKAGANIEQLQRSSTAHIQLSRAGEFYPGTCDRVLLISGSLHSVLTAIFLILEKVSRDDNSKRTNEPLNIDRRPFIKNLDEETVKLALTRRLCSLLIGRGGQTVRDFINNSGAIIRVQSLSELTPSDPERIVTISGLRDRVLRAIALVLNALSMHEQYSSYMETTLQLATNQGIVLPPRPATTKSSSLNNVRAQLTLFLRDDDVGAILGQKGKKLIEIQKSTRVSIRISERAKMDASTNEREVTISGQYGALRLAEATIAERLTQSRSRRRLAMEATGAENLDSVPKATRDGTPNNAVAFNAKTDAVTAFNNDRVGMEGVPFNS